MRMRGSRQQKRALRNGDLTLVYSALNALGTVGFCCVVCIVFGNCELL
jgi:hypothetical protein